MRRRLWLGLGPAGALGVAVVACSGRPAAALALSMRAPQGLLDDATTVELLVFDAAGATCASDGSVSGIPGGAQRFDLAHAGCADGIAWCQTISLDRDGSTKMFAVEARSPAGILAQGCTTAVVDQDPLVVDLKVQRYNPPACCNDGVLEAGEQCEAAPGPIGCDGKPTTKCSGITTDAVCNCDCTSREILVSVDDGVKDPKLVNGAPGTKSKLAMTFAPGNVEVGTALRMIYLNTAPDGNSPHLSPVGDDDVSVSFLGGDLYPIASPAPLALQLELPLTCNDVEGKGILFHQDAPDLAVASNDTIAMVYTSDEDMTGTSDVFLTPSTVDGCTDNHLCASDAECQTGKCVMGSPSRCAAAVKLNAVVESTPGVSASRVAAGPDGEVMAVWLRNGHAFGRIWKTDGTLVPTSQEIDVADDASNPRIAGSSTGFTVVYEGSADQDADAIVMKSFDATGAAVGAETRVNTATAGLQDQPAVAELPDGRVMVVWRSGGQIWGQRYDKTGKAIAGDQEAPVSTSASKDLAAPAIASSGSAGSFFAIAWEDDKDATISGRFADGDAGFLFNSVTGQNDEFLATDETIAGKRSAPAVTVGGKGYVVLGWQDDSTVHPGIYVRRFPLPK